MGEVEPKEGLIRSGPDPHLFRSWFTSCALAVRSPFTCRAPSTHYACRGRGKERLLDERQDRRAASELMRVWRRASEFCDGGLGR
jgi:hypothetical protein